MKRLAMVLLILFTLVPGRADADGGGFWDWFWSWDPEFVGGSAEFHLLCLDENGNQIRGCHEHFSNVVKLFKDQTKDRDGKNKNEITHCFRMLANPDAPEPEISDTNPCPLGQRYSMRTGLQIKHKINLLVGYHHNISDRYHEQPTDKQEALSALGSIHVVRFMFMYYRQLHEMVDVGGGIGALRIQGENFTPFARGMITPVSFLFYPIKGAKAFVVKPELNYILGGFKAADFGDDPAKFSFSKEHEWNLSISVGFDLFRVGRFLGQ
jgi:hypothetical protein